MWITNGGFADVFIVFAKVDGEAFSAFIVERGFPGVSTGKEEHKLGLLGSSTTPLILQDAKVPAANLLGEIGKGHKIAFNTLNYGRLKLGAMCSGGARLAIEEAARYAAQRKQFGKPIASFGAIKQKLGDMVSRQYAVEAMLYRTAGPDRRDAGGRATDRSRSWRRWRSSRSKRPSSRSRAARRSTSSSTRTSRSTAATASCATTRPSGTIATRASTASSRGPTRSTACSSRACSRDAPSRARCRSFRRRNG